MILYILSVCVHAIEPRPSPARTVPEKAKRVLDEVKSHVMYMATIPEEGKQVTFDIWDFAGQHVYYTSHQTFLGKRAIYLLVMDMSKSLDDVLVTDLKDVPMKWKDTGTPRTVKGK